MKEVQQKRLIKENEIKLIKTQQVLKKQLIQLKNNEIREYNRKRFKMEKGGNQNQNQTICDKMIKQLKNK